MKIKSDAAPVASPFAKIIGGLNTLSVDIKYGDDSADYTVDNTALMSSYSESLKASGLHGAMLDGVIKGLRAMATEAGVTRLTGAFLLSPIAGRTDRPSTCPSELWEPLKAWFQDGQDDATKAARFAKSEGDTLTPFQQALLSNGDKSVATVMNNLSARVDRENKAADAPKNNLPKHWTAAPITRYTKLIAALKKESESKNFTADAPDRDVVEGILTINEMITLSEKMVKILQDTTYEG
tara:strand:- start:57 stop:773 length:717 start_codon:yes stop_codon:yes gene_type:complete